MSLTASALKQVTDLGYVVKIFRMTGKPPLTPARFTEMHAVHTPDAEQQFVARVDDDDDEAEYRCACLLAEMVGVRLEG